ncbi:uncharacterized protein M6B38_316985 [Iris pallida]|uniref:Uncharacterized protein n=1 Tax=Iris pallida TaxID=29817 RepID=A0AAX6HF40_IRIPA|nr:uncharacterized protein M6B38_316985 [Iris pallida]
MGQEAETHQERSGGRSLVQRLLTLAECDQDVRRTLEAPMGGCQPRRPGESSSASFEESVRCWHQHWYGDEVTRAVFGVVEETPPGGAQQGLAGHDGDGRCGSR